MSSQHKVCPLFWADRGVRVILMLIAWLGGR